MYDKLSHCFHARFENLRTECMGLCKREIPHERFLQ